MSEHAISQRVRPHVSINAFPMPLAVRPALNSHPGRQLLSFGGKGEMQFQSRQMNIYVGNLPFPTTEDDLRQAFEEFGAVDSATIIKDRFTGKSRGFGFVEMPEQSEAEAAINNLNGEDFGGRTLTVNEARPRDERPRRGGDRGGRESY